MKDMKGMKEKLVRFSPISTKVIGCAIEVHRELGPGLLENTYERCLSRELEMNGVDHICQSVLPVHYKGMQIDCGYRIDLFVNNELIVKLKAVDRLLPIHEAQLLTYMKLSKTRYGLLINFNVNQLKKGLKSFVL